MAALLKPRQRPLLLLAVLATSSALDIRGADLPCTTFEQDVVFGAYYDIPSTTYQWAYNGYEATMSMANRYAQCAQVLGTANFDMYIKVESDSGGTWIQTKCTTEPRCTGSGPYSRCYTLTPAPQSPATVYRCSQSLANAQAAQDPHLTLAHGGRADFRGTHGALYNFLSSSNVSVNVRTDNSTFMLGKSTIHGSFMTEVHVAMLTTATATALPRWFNVSFWGAELNDGGWSYRMINGTCSKVNSPNPSKFTLGPHNAKVCDNLVLKTAHSSATISTTEWEITVTGQPIYSRIDGPHRRIDLELKQKVSDHEFKLQPHGLVGQSFDGDDAARHGRLDAYPPPNATAEFTTSAMAQGAIDGVAAEYVMGSRYATSFKYSAFGSWPTAEQLTREPFWTRRHRRLREQARKLARARSTV